VAREAAQKAVREADRAAAELWSIQMEAYGGPAQPSPTIAQCLNGGYPQWLRTTERDVPEEIFLRLKEAHDEWVEFLSKTNPSHKRHRATKDIVDYHARELKHFGSLTGRN
jgi:hypothetical protein